MQTRLSKKCLCLQQKKERTKERKGQRCHRAADTLLRYAQVSAAVYEELRGMAV